MEPQYQRRRHPSKCCGPKKKVLHAKTITFVSCLLLLTSTLESMEVVRPKPKEKELTNFLICHALILCLGPLQCGFNFWLIHDPLTFKQYLQDLFTENVDVGSQNTNISPGLLIFTVSSFLLGCLFGSLLFALLADKLGRKGMILINDLFSTVSGIVLAISHSFKAHIVYAFARFSLGLYTGIFTSGIPLYLGEIAATNQRGGLSILHFFFISAGILVCQLLGAPEVLGSEKRFSYLLSFSGIMGFFQLLFLLPFPESPRYLLIQKGDEEGARQALQKFRGEDDVEDEIENLQQEDLYEKEEKEMTVIKLLCSPDQRWQLGCVLALITTQQFSGMTSAYYYAERVFRAMKVEEYNLRYCSALLTVSGFFGQGLAIYKIDSVGRRPLLLFGFGICIISCILLTMTLELQVILPWAANVSSFLLVVFLTGIVLGPNSIPHLMITELFLQSSRATAFAVAGFYQWILLFLVVFTYLSVEKHIETYSFIIFLPFCVVGFYYILKVVPETKNKTFLDIRKLLEAYLGQKFLNKKPEGKKTRRRK